MIRAAGIACVVILAGALASPVDPPDSDVADAEDEHRDADGRLSLRTDSIAAQASVSRRRGERGWSVSGSVAPFETFAARSESFEVEGRLARRPRREYTNDELFVVGAGEEAAFIAGDFTQTPRGVLRVMLGPDDASIQDGSFIIDGAAALSGALKIVWESETPPLCGDEFVLIRAWSIEGAFEHVAFDGLPDDLKFEIGYEREMVRLGIFSR